MKVAQEGPSAIVIAHRGASGYVPGHTIEAYTLAYNQGADFLEPDLVMSKDGALVCSHDLTVTRRSNAARLYPDLVDDQGNIKLMDLELSEIQAIEITDDEGRGSYRLMSFQEFLDLVQRLNAGKNRMVGIIPELKAPGLHRAQGLPMEAKLLARLLEAGHGDHPELVILQGFEQESMRRLGEEQASPFPLVLCLGKNTTHEDLISVAEYCQGIAPHRSAIEDSETGATTDLIDEAHQLGLRVFPYTFLDEEESMRRYFHNHGVDGLFTDFPDIGVSARDNP